MCRIMCYFLPNFYVHILCLVITFPFFVYFRGRTRCKYERELWEPKRAPPVDGCFWAFSARRLCTTSCKHYLAQPMPMRRAMRGTPRYRGPATAGQNHSFLRYRGAILGRMAAAAAAVCLFVKKGVVVPPVAARRPAASRGVGWRTTQVRLGHANIAAIENK